MFVALSLGRPILLEGEVGVGKTEVAKVLATVFGRRLIRLQCYEGIDTNQALYEWDYARQMLQIRALSERQLDDDDAVDKLFGPKFLLERPLLEAVRAGDRRVLLIDEIDRADDEFEAFLLELLSDFQITIPEIGTITADTPPLVILTSNRTRELHDALKRRCLYHWVGYPSVEREVEIVLLRVPGVSEALARKVVAAVNRLRELDLAKPPGVAETIDWVAHARRARRDRPRRRAPLDDTLGAVVKERDDLDLVREQPRGDRLRCLTRRRSSSCSSPSVTSCARPGLVVGSGDVMTYCAAMAVARPERPRRPLLGRPDDDGHPPRPDPRLRPGVPAVLPRRATDAVRVRCAATIRAATPTQSVLEVPATEPGGRRAATRRRPASGCMASDADIWRNKSFAACTPEELAAVRRIMKRIRLTPPRRRTRRTATAPARRRGWTCAARSARRCARTASRPSCSGAGAGCALRPLMLILDVSGSMSDYSRNLLQFAYSTRQRPRRGSRCSASAPG